MVENILKNYKCPYCGATDMNERHIDIIGAAGNTVNIDINCPSCKKHFMAKTEVMQMDVANLSGEKLASLQQAIEALKGKLGGDIEIDAQFLSGRIEETSKEDSIQDTEIQALQKSLSQKGELQVDDLFADDQADENH